MNNDAIPRSLFFLAGAGAGLAFGYYLYSEDGEELREQLRKYWDDFLQIVADGTQEQVNTLLANLNTVLEKGLQLAEDLGEDVQESGEDAMDLIEDAGSSFEAGLNKARATLQRKLALAGLGEEA